MKLRAYRRAAVSFFALAVLAVLLSGCGWHLRGYGGASLQGRSIYLRAPSDQPRLAAALRRGLEAAGATLATDAKAADAVVEVDSPRVGRRASSFSTSARVEEYELRYSLPFRVLGPKGQPWAARQTVIDTRTYPYDTNNVLSSQSQERQLRREMAEEVANLLVGRVQAVISRHQSAK